MKTMIAALGCTALVFVAPLAVASETMNLNGSFVWEREDGSSDGPLAAVFTKTGDETWEVEFNFTWEDEAHKYTGTATGARKGDFSGEILGDNPEREMRFQFSLSFNDGSYSGKHAFIDEDGASDSGTLTLSE